MPSPSFPTIRILMVESQTLVRAGLRMLIESKPGLVVVGEADSPESALRIAAQEQPDIILFEPGRERDPGLTLIPQLLSAASQARLLMVTSEGNPEVHRQAARLGAMGVILKDQSPDLLIKAIQKVYAGEAWFNRAATANILTGLTRANAAGNANSEAGKIAALSEREREIISLVGQGLKNKEIRERLCISESTVRHHLTSIFAKLGISDRLELLIYAYQHNLAQLPSRQTE